MGVTFIRGRAGTGKTRACLEAILAELSDADQGPPLVLLVPEQASFQMERTLAINAPRQGYTRAAVLSFSRLAWRVFSELGIEPDWIDTQARILALRHIAQQQASALKALRKSARTTGFYVELSRTIEELLRENVTPDAFTAAASHLDDDAPGRKTREIAQLYEAYVQWLGPTRVDAAARLTLLRDRLAEIPWLRAAAIWVDGFAGFTGQELETLVALTTRARTVTLTLLLDPAAPAAARPGQPPDPLGLFARTEQTYQQLRRRFTEAGVAVDTTDLTPAPPPRFADTPSLAALEAGLATPIGVPVENAPTSVSPDVRLLEFATARDELRAAAHWIRERVHDSSGTLRFRDFALIARDLEPFASLIAEVFAEYDIPHFLDRRRSMAGHPLSRLVAGLLAAAASDFDQAAAVTLLRSRLLPLTRDQAEQIENLLIRHEIRGSTYWRQPHWELEEGASTDACAPERRHIADTLQPLTDLATAAPAPAAAWARTLYEVLETLGVRRRIETWMDDARRERRWESAETHRLAWEALCEVLDDLHRVLGPAPLSADDVAAILRTSLTELTLGLAPPTVDQVLVGSIERSRHPDIRCAWVFGFNEGLFPARPAEDVLLGTAERQALHARGLPAPAPHRDDALNERLLAYIALTRASRELVISYAKADEAGDALMPSSLLDDVRQALPGLAPAEHDADAPPVCIEELARRSLSATDAAGAQQLAALCATLAADERHAERLRWLLRGRAYDNTPAAVTPYRVPPAETGAAWRGSPSEVERALRCPFKHFAHDGLRLDPARGPQPVRWDLGNIAHDILARVTLLAAAEPGGVRAVSDERWQALLDEAIAEQHRQQPADLARRRPELAFNTTLLTSFLRDVVRVHAERWQRGAFEPLYCEQLFDPARDGDALRGLVLELDDRRTIHLRGKIDRLDAADTAGGRLMLVYDYKSSTETLTQAFLTGKRLQLFSYLAAVRQFFGNDPAVQCAGVLLAPLYPSFKALDAGYVARSDERDQLLYLYQPRGLFSEAAAAALHVGHTDDYSPVASMRRKKDGDFYETSDVFASDDIVRRIALAEQTIAQTAASIVAGTIDVAPLVERNTLACRNCDFRRVCRFDRAYNRPRAAETVLPILAPHDGEGDA